jgi:nicotinate dehydrogenase subunit B
MSGPDDRQSTQRPTPGDRLDRWLRLEADGQITVLTGKVELGQGIHAALAQLVADELDAPFDRVRIATVDTDASPDEGNTAGSRSIEESGAAFRKVAAEARAALLEAAAAHFATDPVSLGIDSGVIAAPDGRSLSFSELAAARPLDRELRLDARPKPPGERGLIGRSTPRRDLVPKVTGQPAFVQDIDVPGMLHGRILRPPSYGARLESLDDADLRALPGVVRVVRDGSFVGIVAEREDQAVRALEHARGIATWSQDDPLPPTHDPRYLLTAPDEAVVIHERHDPASGPVRRVISAEYTREHLAHASLGPSCAVATLDDARMTVWSHSQSVFALRHELAMVLGVGDAAVRVVHREGAGCYGHNGADDVALDAALLARAVPGLPVRVQWMREDEFCWEPFGPAMVIQLSAGLDAHDRIVDWTHHGWGHGHEARPSTSRTGSVSALLAARHLATPFQPPPGRRPQSASSGGRRNAPPVYAFPNQSIVDHYVARAPLRVSSLRSLGAHPNVFAIESFMDEIAAAVDRDPVEYRLAHLRDPRARAVLEAVADLAGWRAGERGDGERGRGVGLARYKSTSTYAAVIAEVELGAEARVSRVWAAIDAGMVVSRDGLLNQVEGGIVQAASWTLHEAIKTDGPAIATRSWETYRTMRFPEAPELFVSIIDRPADPPLGAGEAVAGPTAGAIANAVANGLGLRVRDLPITRERLVAAIG